MPRKVFTAGEVLAAADVNTFLMDQVVQSFPTAAARGSAIPSPTLGMYTHLEDAPARTQFWNGSAFVSPFGLTLINSSAISGVSSFSLPNNTFTAAFDNYLILLNIDSIASGATTINYRLRASGVDNSSTNYNFCSIERGNGSTSFGPVNGSGSSLARLGFASSGERATMSILLRNPFNSGRTTSSNEFIRDGSATFIGNEIGSASFGQNDSFDSISFLFPGNITGNIATFGYRKN